MRVAFNLFFGNYTGVTAQAAVTTTAADRNRLIVRRDRKCTFGYRVLVPHVPRPHFCNTCAPRNPTYFLVWIDIFLSMFL